MQKLNHPIRAEISSLDPKHHPDGSANFESVPDAIAACRRHFMSGNRDSCTVYQDSLIYTIDVSPAWNGEALP